MKAPNPIVERLIGFDARYPLMLPEPLWDATRRSSFLLREDVRRPLSVDTLVWSSIFDTGQGIGLPSAERTRLRLNGIRTPAWIGANGGLWENLSRMAEAARGGGIDCADGRVCTVLGVTWLSDRNFEDGEPFGPYAEPTDPLILGDAWTLLGLDVADGSAVSGLANCGHTAEEIDDLRQRWAPSLNDHHLFRDPEGAFEFREIAGRRVLEHAPFFVYGLYVHRPDGGNLP